MPKTTTKAKKKPGRPKKVKPVEQEATTALQPPAQDPALNKAQNEAAQALSQAGASGARGASHKLGSAYLGSNPAVDVKTKRGAEYDFYDVPEGEENPFVDKEQPANNVGNTPPPQTDGMAKLKEDVAKRAVMFVTKMGLKANYQQVLHSKKMQTARSVGDLVDAGLGVFAAAFQQARVVETNGGEGIVYPEKRGYAGQPSNAPKWKCPTCEAINEFKKQGTDQPEMCVACAGFFPFVEPIENK